MITILIFEDTGDGVKLLYSEKDITRFSGVYINSGINEDLEAELGSIIYDENGKMLLRELSCDELVTVIQESDVKVINCGFIA